MFSMCSELTLRAPILETRIPQLMQPCLVVELEKMRLTLVENSRDREFSLTSALLETFIKSNQIDLNQCIKGQLLIFILSTLCQLWTQLGHLGAPGTVAAKHAVEG